MDNWRVAGSLLTLLAEVNAAHPKRDKRTDGTISGYPGAISSHNINAAGVVCALDITTGMFSGGITPAQGIALADKIRIKLRDQPRGIPCYVIHNGKIASAGDNYKWLPYTGPDPHTSHIHVSVDWDIAGGGSASGQADYDTDLPWGISGTTEEELTVSEASKIIAIVTENQARITRTRDIVTENQARINQTNAALAAVAGVVAQLAKGQGVTIDYARIDAGVSAALAAGIKIEGTLSAGGAE